MPKDIIVKNSKFNRWTILNEEESYKQPNGKLCRMFKCKCDCGNIRIIRWASIKNNQSKSCGCYMKEVNGDRIGKQSKTHGNTTLKDNEYKSLFLFGIL